MNCSLQQYRTRAAVLCAVRLLQRTPILPHDLHNICTGGAQFAPLTNSELEDLCCAIDNGDPDADEAVAELVTVARKLRDRVHWYGEAEHDPDDRELVGEADAILAEFGTPEPAPLEQRLADALRAAEGVCASFGDRGNVAAAAVAKQARAVLAEFDK